MSEVFDKLAPIFDQLDGLAHLLGTTGEAIPPEAAHGLALILAGLAERGRKAI